MGGANRRTSKAPKDKEIKKKVDAPKVKFEIKLLGDTILASKCLFIIKLVKQQIISEIVTYNLRDCVKSLNEPNDPRYFTLLRRYRKTNLV